MDAVFLVAPTGSLAGACVYGHLIRRHLAELNGGVNALRTEIKKKDEELPCLGRGQRTDRQRIEDLRLIQYKATSR